MTKFREIKKYFVGQNLKQKIVGHVIGWFHAIFDVCFLILGVTVLVLCSMDCIHVEDDRPVLKDILRSFCDEFGRICKL